jgi:hypothetical protein
MAKKIIRLTESDLARIVKRVLMEQETNPVDQVIACLATQQPPITVPDTCIGIINKLMTKQAPTFDEMASCGMSASGVLISNGPKILECASKIASQSPSKI